MSKRTFSSFAFKTKEEAQTFVRKIRNKEELRTGNSEFRCTGGVFTAHVVGPGRKGAHPDWPYIVSVGCRRQK